MFLPANLFVGVVRKISIFKGIIVLLIFLIFRKSSLVFEVVSSGRVDRNRVKFDTLYSWNKLLRDISNCKDRSCINNITQFFNQQELLMYL